MSAAFHDRRIDGFETEELVAALPHLSMIRHKMRADLRVAPEVTESSALGLARVKIKGLETAEVAARVRRLSANQSEVRKRRPWLAFPDQPAADASPLDHLMYYLRCRFVDEWDGWMPVLGKNRFTPNVTSLPHISGGGVGPPKPAEGRPEPPAGVSPSAGTGVRVAVLDTMLYQHPDLAGGYLAEKECLFGPGQPEPGPPWPYWLGHATFVSGLIRRYAPAAALDVRRVLDDQATATAWDVACRMVELRDAGVQVINLSLGCHTADGAPPLVLSRAVELLAPDVVIVAAAGNHGNSGPTEHWPHLTPKTPLFPAALPSVVAVGAHDRFAVPTKFSPKVPWLTFTAPGVDVVSTYLEGEVQVKFPEHDHETEAAHHPGEPAPPEPFDGFASWSGTSLSSAIVTGILASLADPGCRGGWVALRRLEEQIRRETKRGTKGIVRVPKL